MSLSFKLQPRKLNLCITKPETFELNENELPIGVSVELIIEFWVRSTSLWAIRSLDGGISIVQRKSGPSITHRHGFVPSIFTSPLYRLYQSISGVLFIMGINLEPEAQRNVLNRIVSSAFEIVNLDNSGEKPLFMCVELTEHSVYLHDEAEVIRQTLLLSEEERYNQMMKGASKAAIDSLEIVEFYDGNQFITSCMVCLDEFETTTGSEVTLLRLPCSHVFHDNCIKQWLEKSHFCPICRFEMPINEAQNANGNFVS